MNLPKIEMLIASPENIKTRTDTCASCDKTKDMSDNPLYFFVDGIGNLIPDAPKTMCTECACPVWVKVRWPKNTCPLNKWEK